MAAFLLCLVMPVVARAADSGAVARSRALESLLRQLRGLDTAGRIEAVNRYFNSCPQRSDEDNRGVRDYWSTPFELVQRGRGDCEDLAIVKFYALLRLGIPEDRLRLVITRIYRADDRRIEGHMVLVYRADDRREWVLDSYDRSLRVLDARTDLVPRMSFNRTGVWRVNRDPFAPGQAAARIRSWQNLLVRLDGTSASGAPAGQAAATAISRSGR